MGEGDADAQLMLRYAAGDVRAFDELYATHRGGLWRFIRRSVRDAAATDDVFQDCWSRVIAHRENYRPEARFATWLYRIARNCCVDYWRRSGRREAREAADEEALLAAAGKTGRVVIIQEAPRTAGYGAELAAILAEKAMLDLRGPVLRVTGYDVPYPYWQIEDAYMPSVERVVDAVERLLEF